MGALQSTPMEESEREREREAFPDLTIRTVLHKNARRPEWTRGNSSTLTLYSLHDVVLQASEPTVVETGVVLELQFMLVALLVPCNELVDRVETVQQVMCSDNTAATPTLIYTPTPGEPQELRLERHTEVAKLLVLPVARPKLEIAIRADADASGSGSNGDRGGGGALHKSQCAEEAARVLAAAQAVTPLQERGEDRV